jgi:hypothetical protein
MYKTRFLCLAVARRDGGSCIAGIDIESGKWVRPVNAKNHGALGDCEIVVRDRLTQKLRMLEPLDVLQLRLDKYAGDNGQPENWELAPPFRAESYTVQRHMDGQDAAMLISYLQRNGPLLHSHSGSIPASEIEARALTASLALIRPEQLHWRVTPKASYPKDLQVRADFLFDQTLYSLVLTDPVWEEKCRRLGPGRHPHSAIADTDGQVLLTVSLAALPLYGFHYKLAAGVVCLPGA